MEDKYEWRCVCRNENPSTAMDCFKCRKQRWLQLGFSRLDAWTLLQAITPSPRKSFIKFPTYNN